MLALARSGGGSSNSVVFLSATFPTIGGEESFDILVLGENFLHNFCGSCCSGWCWIFRRVTVCHIYLLLKFGGEAAHNIFHEVGLDVAGLFRIQFPGFSEF